jgi:hypothetical protein
MKSLFLAHSLTVLVLAVLAGSVSSQVPPGEAPKLGPVRITQADITGGGLTLDDIRKEGLKIFSSNFNKHDGYGDGPENLADTTSPGGRPTLQDNGTFLRINGLDSQSCMECHSVGSSDTAPFTFAIGGVGGSNNNALFQSTEIDVDDSLGLGYAFYNGRYINPPFLFGAGGVELLAKEMTTDMRAIRRRAHANPNVIFPLVTKGVSFGELSYDFFSQSYVTSGIEGVDDDLVVRPFGRKGDNATVRQFDVGALQFHLGMQPVEAVGAGVDSDNDGVTDEILIGELSALHIFNTNLERPVEDALDPDGIAGSILFGTLGCSTCHVPFLDTISPVLTYSFPENHVSPKQNTFYAVDLLTSPAGFDANGGGGVRARLFSDLKRHDMGPDLAETFGSSIDAEFVTARLWGIADTAPYLHDGRALTLTEAISQHGGEAQTVRDAFVALPDADKISLLTFLRSLRTPVDPATDLL